SLRLKIDDNFYTKFKDDHPLSQAVNAFSSHFQFVGSVDLILKPRNGTVLDEENLNELRVLESRISVWPEVSRLTSVRQVSDELARLLSGYSSSEREARRKSLLSLLDNYGSLKELYHSPSNEARTVVFLRSLSTEDFRSALKRIDQVKQDFAGKLDIEVSGFAAIRDYINNQVIRDLFESFILSFILIYLCFLYLYRHPGWAMLALLPNALPLLLITGAIGVSGVPVDGNLAILLCVAFGISGDNTMQLTYVIRQNRIDAPTYEEGLALAIRQVGLPIFATSAIFIFCLPAFLLGHLRLFDHMAVYLSLAFAMAFFADLFTFPALHVLLRKKI
ncbi:MAG TPA: MMPL family transporter, partial [Bdellovibrionota bacterium]|nr:MMPL family transporter [Bdellovibrionota bacterium]